MNSVQKKTKINNVSQVQLNVLEYIGSSPVGVQMATIRAMRTRLPPQCGQFGREMLLSPSLSSSTHTHRNSSFSRFSLVYISTTGYNHTRTQSHSLFPPSFYSVLFLQPSSSFSPMAIENPTTSTSSVSVSTSKSCFVSSNDGTVISLTAWPSGPEITFVENRGWQPTK